MNFIAVIVGRPNVGKSSLFNRIIGHNKSIVNEKSGVTRDRDYGFSEWNGISFIIVDTGGYTISKGIIEKKIKKQVYLAIEEADIILFVVDIMDGLTNLDLEIAQLLRKSKKQVFLIINKVDYKKYIYHSLEFHQLGFSNYFCISSSNGSGTGDLLDKLTKITNTKREFFPKYLKKFAIVGLPNVGKSTIINTLLGEERNIVTNISGTTRNSIDTFYNQFGIECVLIDTAGIRKNSKINEDLEFYSILRTIRAIERSTVCLLVIDAVRGWEKQDMNILRILKKNGKGFIVVVNKWDLIEKKEKKNSEKKIKEKISYFEYIPIFFFSALSKKKKDILKIMEELMRISENCKRKIKTKVLNDLFLPIIENNPPPKVNGKQIKVKYCTQLSKMRFVFFSNYPKSVKDSYNRFLEKKLRGDFSFLKGVTINIFFT
jgi:GTPase